MEDIAIEHLGKEHIPQAIEIERASFSAPWSMNSFMSELHNPHGVSLVALSGAIVAGYVLATCILDEGHILNIAVREAYRRRGVAGRLLQRVLDGLRRRGCRQVFLEVRASNTAAITLYEKAGFREIGRRRLYYIQPFEDAVLMMLSL
jgi:ribosomal-protein-alanine N-acetyltransferase